MVRWKHNKNAKQKKPDKNDRFLFAVLATEILLVTTNLWIYLVKRQLGKESYGIEKVFWFENFCRRWYDGLPSQKYNLLRYCHDISGICEDGSSFETLPGAGYPIHKTEVCAAESVLHQAWDARKKEASSTGYTACVAGDSVRSGSGEGTPTPKAASFEYPPPNFIHAAVISMTNQN